MKSGCLRIAHHIGYSQNPMSIRQNITPTGSPRLPDFANLGIWLRILLGVHGLALLGALAANRRLSELPDELLALAAHLEPTLIACLLILRLLQPLLKALHPGFSATLAWSVVLSCSGGVMAFQISLGMNSTEALPRTLFWSTLMYLAMLFYFDQRARMQIPALTEARLAALTARIRPHFLFNSLNAVLGVIRTEPRRAEEALEELSDLFRALMRENTQLTSLSEEIALARQYLSIEHLRLGERLQVRWQIDAIPPDTRVPPLMLQPLLENAVYHGIEPLENPGEIVITIQQQGNEMVLEIINPYSTHAASHVGNQMALNNIRERLSLFYDLEARLEAGPEEPLGTDTQTQRYRVRMTLPCRHGLRS